MKKHELKELIKECMNEVAGIPPSDLKAALMTRGYSESSANIITAQYHSGQKIGTEDKTANDVQDIVSKYNSHHVNIVESKSLDIGDGFYIIKTGLDVNGNSCVWVARGSNRAKKIQTNGNTPAAHGVSAEEIVNNPVAIQQIKDYYTKYLMKEWGMSVESNPAEEAADLDIKKLDIEDMKRLIANPDPRMVKMYSKNKLGYVDMLKKKLAALESGVAISE